jgi:Protein tyrosine phosphatase-like protein, PTPLA
MHASISDKLHKFLAVATLQNYFAMALTAGSWALVEVPRYLFYFANLGGSSQVPDSLFWLRYSLFAILYPR